MSTEPRYYSKYNSSKYIFTPFRKKKYKEALSNCIELNLPYGIFSGIVNFLYEKKKIDYDTLCRICSVFLSSHSKQYKKYLIEKNFPDKFKYIHPSLRCNLSKVEKVGSVKHKRRKRKEHKQVLINSKILYKSFKTDQKLFL